MISFRGIHVEKDIVLTRGRGYVASPMSSRQREEIMSERGVVGDHAPLHRGILKSARQLKQASYRDTRPL